uniref:Uncharacterized protein n=1 Tax=Oryza rufipogon TaxID=4529 RepID=A0A0E0P8G4_ORYRU
MAAITLETVAAWLQQQNREGQASTGNEEGQANIGSTGMCMEDSSSEVSLSLLEQPQGSQVGDVSHAPWSTLSQTSSSLSPSTMGTNDVNYNWYSEGEDTYDSDDEYDEYDSDDEYDEYDSDDEYDEVSSVNNVYTPTSVLSPTLASVLGTNSDASDNDSDATNSDASASAPISNVVVGCRTCIVFIMMMEDWMACQTFLLGKGYVIANSQLQGLNISQKEDFFYRKCLVERLHGLGWVQKGIFLLYADWFRLWEKWWTALSHIRSSAYHVLCTQVGG